MSIKVYTREGREKKVATPIGQEGPVGAFSAYMSASQSIPHEVDTRLNINTKDYDHSGWFDTSTYRYTPKVEGYYRFSCFAPLENPGDQTRLHVTLRKNGSAHRYFQLINARQSFDAADAQSTHGTTTAYANGTTDYFEVAIYHRGSGAARNAWGGSLYGTRFAGELIKPMSYLPNLLPERVTALPTNPYDGQEVYYVADAANGVLWHLKYRAASSSAYKWEFVGGSPLRHDLYTADDIIAAAAWTVYDHPNPATVTPPLAGEYDITASMVAAINAAGVVTARAWVRQGTNNLGGGAWADAGLRDQWDMHTIPVFTRNTLAAGTAVRTGYEHSNTTQTVQWRGKRLLLTPVRVG